MDPALIQIMRDTLLRPSEVTAFTWGNPEVREDGSHRIHVARSKTDQATEGVILYLNQSQGEKRRDMG